MMIRKCSNKNCKARIWIIAPGHVHKDLCEQCSKIWAKTCENAASLASYGVYAQKVLSILPIDEEADRLAAEFEASRGKPKTRPLTRRAKE